MDEVRLFSKLHFNGVLVYFILLHLRPTDPRVHSRLPRTAVVGEELGFSRLVPRSLTGPDDRSGSPFDRNKGVLVSPPFPRAALLNLAHILHQCSLALRLRRFALLLRIRVVMALLEHRELFHGTAGEATG